MCLLRVAAARTLRHAWTAWTRVDERWLRHHRERVLAYLADRSRAVHVAVERWAQSHWDRLVTRYGKRKVQQVALVTLLVMTVLCGPLSVLATLGIFHSFAQVSPGSPNVVDPSAGTQSTIHLPPAPSGSAFQPLTSRPTMPHTAPPTMKPGSLSLDPNNATQFTGSDGRLEVDVPAGAVSAADVAGAAGQQVALRVSEVAPPSGSSAGGSGVVTLGSYLLEVVDGQGNHLAHGLRQAVTLKLHVSPQAGALDLRHAVVVFNGARLKSVNGQGPSSTNPANFDLSQHLLMAQWPADPTLTGAGSATPTPMASPTANPTASATPLATPLATVNPTAIPTAIPTASGTGNVGAGIPLSVRRAAASAHAASQPTPTLLFTWNTYAPVAKYGAPDALSVHANSGSLTEGIALDVSAGAGQAMPNLTLSYNSASVSEQHSPQGAAGWVGEGWSLGLGQISWAEHNVTVNQVSPNCQTPCPSSTWENSWELTDPFGISTTLIPLAVTDSTYADDAATWTYCANGGAGAETCPVQFQTANETYAKVYAYVGPNFDAIDNHWNVTPPCWRVYLTNGVMEEFGCTYDSLQWYPVVTSNSIPGGDGESGLVLSGELPAGPHHRPRGGPGAYRLSDGYGANLCRQRWHHLLSARYRAGHRAVGFARLRERDANVLERDVASALPGAVQRREDRHAADQLAVRLQPRGQRGRCAL